MRTVLPGKPQAKLQALCTALWEGKRLVVYISGNALVILGGPHDLIQTIYHDEGLVLDAVAVDEATGKMATSSSEDVYIYKPHGEKEGALKWSLQSSLRLTSQAHNSTTLSWGSNEELLLGSESLRLYQTAEEENIIWSRQISKPVKIATFSYDASFIASTGWHDRLIKLWRRQSSGLDDTRFDFTYLPHPTAVTSIHWRRPIDGNQPLDNVLFSICADSKVRIWAATDPHGLQALQLWAEVDMLESIQSRQIAAQPRSTERYAFIIDSRDFAFATERAVQAAAEGNKKEHHALEHLVEVAKTTPEVCVVLDGHGNMSAWGLENVGCKARKTTDKFNISHVENVGLPFLRDVRFEEDNVEFVNFSQQSGMPFALLVHHFDGSISWYESKLDELFDPSPRLDRLHRKSLWTGHDGSIKKIVRSVSGRALISRTNDNEGLIWKQRDDTSGTALAKMSSLSSSEHIHRTCLLGEGDFIVNLHHHSISIWDARSSVAHQAASCAFEIDGKPLCLLLLPSQSKGHELSYLATITSEMKGIVWRVDLPVKAAPASAIRDPPQATVRQYSTFHLGHADELAFVLPVDPAGSALVDSPFLDTFSRDIAISYSNSGVLYSWTATLNHENSAVNWLATSRLETGIQKPSLASGSSIRKTALVDSSKTRLTIWDPWSGQLEFDAQYAFQETVQDLDWSSTPDDQSILAVGFPYKVVFLAQMRYDYLNAGPAWAPIREINVKELTSHPIGDSAWLGSGNLVIGAGTQLYVYDASVNTSDGMIVDLSIPVHSHRSLNIFDLVTYLNGPLPVFHPQFLTQCILAGKMALVQRIILGLQKSLRFFVAGDELDSFVSLSVNDFYEEHEISYAAKKEMRSSYADFVEDEEPQTVTEHVAASLNGNLTKLAIPQLSSHEQIRLADIVECVATAEKQRRSMDENAMRYLLFFRQHMLAKTQAPTERVNITWREIIWAYHSGSQDILVDLVSRQFHGRMLWEHARESGIFMWMTDVAALRAQFEAIARNEYTKTDEKNPIDCSLYYLALKKKNILIGLWRMAAWNREQFSTQKLLRNDFSETRWKTAALKNAYALLGKRRFEYAAAFFLLAGNLQDAVNVCANQLQDLQLAIAIARVYDGDASPILRSLLENKILPQAALEGNRWLATWAFWMLGRRDMAVRALIAPVDTLVDSPETPKLQSRSYLSTDPALVVFYKQLREKTLLTLKGASAISPRAEWDFVIQNARRYDRMGCDLLALDLVRNWVFRIPPQAPQREMNARDLQTHPRPLLGRRNSLVVDDLSISKGEGEISKPTVLLEEPSSSSLLDGFGF